MDAVILANEGVRLEPLQADHFRGLSAVALDPRIWRFTRDRLSSPSDVERRIRQDLIKMKSGQSLVFVVVDPVADRIIGSTSYLNIDRANRGLEIGATWYHPDFWGTAINPQCKYLILRHAFQSWGAIRVQFCINRRNARSRRAVEKLGAQYEGVFRQHVIQPDGTLRDSVYYSILDSEWPEVQGRLEKRLADGAVGVLSQQTVHSPNPDQCRA